MDVRCWSGPRIGRYLRRSLGGTTEVDVIFCPGPGAGERHTDHMYSLWGALRVWTREWYTFDRQGAVRAMVEELKNMVAARSVHDPPVVLVGFAADACLVITVARELWVEGVAQNRVGVFVFGQIPLSIAGRGPQCDVPGVVIAGNPEQLCAPLARDFALCVDGAYRASTANYVELGDLPCGDLSGGAVECHDIVGPAVTVTHLNHTLTSCLVFGARGFSQSLLDFAWAVRHGALQQMAGPGIPSTRTCSSRSSQSSPAEARGSCA